MVHNYTLSSSTKSCSDLLARTQGSAWGLAKRAAALIEVDVHNVVDEAAWCDTTGVAVHVIAWLLGTEVVGLHTEHEDTEADVVWSQSGDSTTSVATLNRVVELSCGRSADRMVLRRTCSCLICAKSSGVETSNLLAIIVHIWLNCWTDFAVYAFHVIERWRIDVEWSQSGDSTLLLEIAKSFNDSSWGRLTKRGLEPRTMLCLMWVKSSGDSGASWVVAVHIAPEVLADIFVGAFHVIDRWRLTWNWKSVQWKISIAKIFYIGRCKVIAVIYLGAFKMLWG